MIISCFKKFFIFAFLLGSFPGLAQGPTVEEKYAETIEAETIKSHVYKLASDEFAGRETGTETNLLAADYIARQFKNAGISPLPQDDDYFQEVAFSSVRWHDLDLIVNGEKAEHLKDYLSIPQYFPVTNDTLEIRELTFLGYGINDKAYSDYKGKDVRGKHLLVYAGEPKNKSGKYRISNSDSASFWSAETMFKVAIAKMAGAASIWIIDDKFRDQVMMARKQLLSGSTLMGTQEEFSSSFIPHAIISSTLGEKLAGKSRTKIIKARNRITKKGRSDMVIIPVDLQWNAVHDIKSTPGVNVLGFIEGSHPLMKDEVVIVSAHYDHLGKRGKDIYYGADDNASGTSAVIEIAEAMALAKANGEGPARSVLCMLVTGEEKGLLGSQYYAENPVFPLENTVADVNIDMIGRTDTLHKNPFYTYVIGADRLSTELHAINEAANQQYTHLELDYTYNEDDDPNRFYYRSDHYNFARKGIPSIFYFSGVHEDYHRPTDTPDKLMYDKAEAITKLAFHTTWALANRPARIKVDVEGRN